MSKEKTLLLTGWDSDARDYAHAAALALLAYPDAEIRGVSKARLPEALETAKGFARILVLGVSLGGEPQRLARSVRALASQGVSLRWISALPPSASVDGATLKALSPYVRDVSLQETVCACLGVEDGLTEAVNGGWMSGSSPPPTGISGGWCATVCSGRTCSTG